jgi:hypothetical protein
MDGDGDADIVQASPRSNYDTLSPNIVWYENMDGRGTFKTPHVIAGESPGVSIVATADMDGDGDLDVLCGTANTRFDTINWYENVDGKGNFGSQRAISSSEVSEFNGVSSLSTEDLDGDGDLDVLFASFYADKIAWYENTDGRGNFGHQIEITNEDGVGGVFSVLAVDMDGDGDLDVVSGSSRNMGLKTSSNIAWFENRDGRGHFGRKQPLVTKDDGLGFVAAIDVDGDGDLDLIARFASVNIVWYENADGHGTFGPWRRIKSTASWPYFLTTADLDGDGDVDLLSVSSSGLMWHENLAGPDVFAPPQIISQGSFYSVSTGDLDGDGDLDAVAENDFSILWYEQRRIGDINDDGIFNSSDLVLVFQAGKFEDGIDDNASFDEGDWNQDGEFDSSDLVLAFQAGHYEAAAEPLAAEIAAALDWLFAKNEPTRKSRAFVA